METVYITGSNGFIGSWLAKYLNKYYKVIGFGRQKCSRIDEIEYYKWDISNPWNTCEMPEKNPDVIIHAAAMIDKDNLSKQSVITNCLGTYNVLEMAVKTKAKSIIYISSLPIVGEEHNNPIDEELPLKPNSLYHATKAAGELIISQAQSYGIKVVSLRVPSPIGPDMPVKTILPIFIKNALDNLPIRIMGKGTRKQNYLDVRDLAKAIKLIIDKDVNSGVYNIGAKNIISNIDLAKMCRDVLNSECDIALNGDDRLDNLDWTTDDSKLINAIGEYQEHSMKESIIDIARGLK